MIIDLKMAFNCVWHKSPWVTMKKYNINHKLIETIPQLYQHASSGILAQGGVGDWFHTSIGMSFIPFSIFVKKIMSNAFKNHISVLEEKWITNLRFADDINKVAGS